MFLHEFNKIIILRRRALLKGLIPLRILLILKIFKRDPFNGHDLKLNEDGIFNERNSSESFGLLVGTYINIALIA